MPRRSDQLRLLPDLPAAEPRNPRAGLSVSGLVAYERCPRQCHWSVIEPRPRPPSPSARIGSLIHGWIERRAAGQGSLLAVEAPAPDSPSGTGAGPPHTIAIRASSMPAAGHGSQAIR